MITNEDKRTYCQELLDKKAKPNHSRILKASCLDTQLGPMLAIADDQALYFLAFAGNHDLERKIEQLEQKTKSSIIPGSTKLINTIEKELSDYFNGTLKEFKTPLALLGSPFQKNVWQALQKIPFGKTQSYLNVARSLGKPTAFRAVAQANGANQIAIVIPCHRVINANGALGGYASGLMRKEWLLKHETACANAFKKHIVHTP
jgi:AraC family transcriptional regulator, regulatory protein of adaptative response / methylated-DNA-[protein]-cysteine methyltransferase